MAADEDLVAADEDPVEHLQILIPAQAPDGRCAVRQEVRRGESCTSTRCEAKALPGRLLCPEHEALLLGEVG